MAVTADVYPILRRISETTADRRRSRHFETKFCSFRLSLRLLDWCTGDATPLDNYASSGGDLRRRRQGFGDDASIER